MSKGSFFVFTCTNLASKRLLLYFASTNLASKNSCPLQSIRIDNLKGTKFFLKNEMFRVIDTNTVLTSTS
jgi:hypothetical protein